MGVIDDLKKTILSRAGVNSTGDRNVDESVNPKVNVPREEANSFDSARQKLSSLTGILQDTNLQGAISNIHKEGQSADISDTPDSWLAYDSTVRPAVNLFLGDAERILLTWTRDPIVMCCLIKNLAVIGKIHEIIRGKETTRKINEKTGKIRDLDILRKMRGILDAVIGILQKDIGVRVDEEIDFLRHMMLSVLAYMVSTLDSWRRQLSTSIFNALKMGNKSLLKRCLPIDELITVLLAAIQHPVNGIFVKLSRLLTDWTNHFRANIRLRYSCNELAQDKVDEQDLIDRREQIRQQIDLFITVPDSTEILQDLQDRDTNLTTQLIALRSKMQLNNGIPIIGQKGCYLHKIEFLQKLIFYRNTLNVVIKGLQEGYLCANMTEDQLRLSDDPLGELGLGGNTPIFNPPITPFPSDDELQRVLEQDFGIGDDEASSIINRIHADEDPNSGQGVVGNPDTLSGEDALSLHAQMQALEAIADCTQVVDDEVIEQVAKTMQRMETI